MASNVVSRFFESDSSDEEKVVKIVQQPPKTKVQITLKESSSDEETVKRRVRSCKEKKNEDFGNVTKKLKNSLKIKDVDAISSEFEALQKVIIKYQNVEMPKNVVKILLEIEEVSRRMWEDKEQKAKLSKVKMKLLSSLRQKIKKVNKEIEKDIEDCRNNPDKYLSSSSAEEEESESSVEEVIVDKVEEEKVATSNQNRFIKVQKVTTADDGKKKRERKIKAQKKGDSGDVNQAVKQKMQKEMFRQDEVVTFEGCLTKLKELFKMRGKKISDRALLSLYYELKNVISTHKISEILLIKINYLILSTQLDSYNADNIFKWEQVKHVLNVTHEFLTLLNGNDVVFDENISEEQEVITENKGVLIGNVLLIAVKINDELCKVMQNTDQYSLEYVEKMKDIARFTELVVLFQNYLENNGNKDKICGIYLLRIELIYYKLDNQWLLSLKEQLSESLTMDIDIESNSTGESSDENLINSLCRYIFEHGKDRVPLRATLCQIYHHAIHDRLKQARTLFFSSFLQDKVTQSEPAIQVLYNRALVQFGMCAFRQGYYQESLNALKEIQTSGRIKELLAQGVMIKPNTDRSSKQEIMERRSILPFHLHINLELVECIYLLSIMLVEGSSSVAPIQEARNNFNSRSLIYLLRTFDRMPIQGPPEFMRELINAAFRCLRVGEWENCLKHIKSIRCWKLLAHSESVINRLTHRLKQECLIAYIYSNCRSLSTIPLNYLTTHFQLEQSEVIEAINRIIIRDKFPAKWSNDNSLLTIHSHLLPNNTNLMLTSLVDKLTSLSENQSRVYESLNLAVNAKDKFYGTKQKIKP